MALKLFHGLLRLEIILVVIYIPEIIVEFAERFLSLHENLHDVGSHATFEDMNNIQLWTSHLEIGMG